MMLIFARKYKKHGTLKDEYYELQIIIENLLVLQIFFDKNATMYVPMSLLFQMINALSHMVCFLANHKNTIKY